VDTVQSGHFAEEMIKSEKTVSFSSQSERPAEERRHRVFARGEVTLPASNYSKGQLAGPFKLSLFRHVPK
jgi:hypothetical protein